MVLGIITGAELGARENGAGPVENIGSGETKSNKEYSNSNSLTEVCVTETYYESVEL